MAETTTINGTTYRIGKMDTLSQFHVGRKLAPLMVALLEGFKNNRPKAVATFPETGNGHQPPEEVAEDPEASDRFLALLSESDFLTALASMSVEDSEFCIKSCLKVVQVQQGSLYSSLMTKSGVFCFEVDLSTMLSLTFQVLQENIGSFFTIGQPK